jgi:hypothetical protein
VQIEGIIFSGIWYLIFIWFLLKWRGGMSSTRILGLFTAKVLGTFALQWLFTYYYTDRSTADIYRFFDDGILLNQVFYENPIHFFKIIFNLYSDQEAFRLLYFEQMNAWIKPFDSGIYNDNHFMIKVNALLAFLSFGYYEVHGLFFSFLAFIGIKWCAESLIDSDNDKNLAITLAVLFPSSLVWMSGGLKEALLIFGIGAFLKVNFAHFKPKLTSLTLAAVSMLILFSLKIYFIAALIPAFAVHVLREKQNIKRLNQVLIWTGILLTGSYMGYLAGFDLIEYIVRKQNDFLNHVQVISPGSSFDMPYLKESILSVIASIPQALANVLFRPYIYEVNTLPESLMFLENLIIAITIVFSTIRLFRKPDSSKFHFWIILFILPVLILTGMVTPVFGAIMRYRSPAIVLLLIILIPYLRSFWLQHNYNRS